MFSKEEKTILAAILEKAILDLKHPEMPDKNPQFTIHIDGKESWSWADIKPNWTFNKDNPAVSSDWNESARDFMAGK